MNLDLTGLAEIERPTTGEPLLVPLEFISCDPGQPRQYIDEPALHELAKSIRAIGVVQPISVRPDPSADGRYIINYGERRYRAAAIAGLSAIPAFIHKTPSSYTQVAENLHRADLSPMEIALFIQRRLDDGERKHEIADKLGYKRSYVTEHLALLESPVCVEKAYASGVASARTLYDLRRLHEEFPQQVDAWIASGPEVTREAIVAFGQRIRHDELARGRLEDAVNPSRSSAGTSLRARKTSSQPPAVFPVVEADSTKRAATKRDAPPDPGPARSSIPRSLHHDEPGVPTGLKKPIRKLRITVNYDGRSATIEDDSVVRIRYEDGGLAEVRLADAVIVAAVAV